MNLISRKDTKSGALPKRRLFLRFQRLITRLYFRVYFKINPQFFQKIPYKVYQIFYDDSQKEELFWDAIPFNNKNLGLYFENDVIRHLYQENKIEGEHFGVLSWKLRRKNRIHALCLKSLIDGQSDIFTFTYEKHDVVEYADQCHPGFQDIFFELLDYIGMSKDIHPAVGLYQNAIIAKPDVYNRYIENYLVPAIDFFERSSGSLRDLLFSDAGYKGSPTYRNNNPLGMDHYPYHTFILERLWSVFFDVHKHQFSLKFIGRVKNTLV